MRYLENRIVLQEIPGEISLAFLIGGCTLRCKGCHSAYAWKESLGKELTTDLIKQAYNEYKDYLTCILFMGGEWMPEQMENLLGVAKDCKYKTALYTGLELSEVDIRQKPYSMLNYIKVGRWKPDKGPIDSPKSNQKLYKLPDLQDITYRFYSNVK